MDEGSTVLLNGEELSLGSGFDRLMEGVAVALTAPDVGTATQMYLRLGEGVRFAEMISISKRVEAQRLLRTVKDRSLDGLRRWVDRFGAPHYEVAHAFKLLDMVVRFDYAQVNEAMENASTPEEAGWTLAIHLATQEDALARDVVPRDIVRAVTKSGLNGALTLTKELKALPINMDIVNANAA